VEDLVAFMELDEDDTDKKILQLITSVLWGKALDSFRTYQAAQEEASNGKCKEPWEDEDVLEHILNDMANDLIRNGLVAHLLYPRRRCKMSMWWLITGFWTVN
jgi:hypothetical protein